MSELSSITSNITMISPREVGFGGRGLHLVLASTIGPAIATLLVANRVYIRWRQRNLAWDDYASISGLSFLYAHATVNIVGVNFGYGRPSSTLSATDLRKALLCFYLCQIFYKLSINTTKISICFLYLRVFPQVHWFCRLSWSLVVIITLYMFSSVFATVFQCWPVGLAWGQGRRFGDTTPNDSNYGYSSYNGYNDTYSSYGSYNNFTTINTINTTATQPSVDGRCINLLIFWNTTATFNVLTTLILLISVPIVVWSPSLTLPRRSKLDLTPVFLLGLFDLATAILRFTTLTTSSRASTGDATAGSFTSTVWTVVEASTAVVCASLPLVRNTGRLLFKGRVGRRGGDGNGRRSKGTNVGGVGMQGSGDDAVTLTSPTFVALTASEEDGEEERGVEERNGSRTSLATLTRRSEEQKASLATESDFRTLVVESCGCGVCWQCRARKWQCEREREMLKRATGDVEMSWPERKERGAQGKREGVGETEIEEIEMTITTPRSVRTLVEQRSLDVEGGLSMGGRGWKEV